MKIRGQFKEHGPFILAACFAIAWAVARACVQSVTLDESDSYLSIVAADWPAHWYPHSNNHVLNSIVERIFITAFGLSHLTLRAGALIGGAIYVAASYALCRRISNRHALLWPMFLCLVYNPFVMDYMVAARGYGLALGCMMAAVLAISEERFATASIFAGLSFSSNFSFAYINAALILAACVWIFSQKRNWRLIGRCVIPSVVTAYLICGWTAWRFPKAQLYYGATHLTQTWESIAASLFDDLNPFIVNPLVAPVLKTLRPAILIMVVVLLIWHTLRIVWAGNMLGLLLSRAIAIAILCHWLAFRLKRIPLPMERTAIFFVPLAILLIGIGAALPSAPGWRSWQRPATVLVLILSTVYFIGCLRLWYFKEWKFDADVKDAYSVLRALHSRDGIREFEIDWRYANPLNFYRKYFHDDDIVPFEWHETLREGQPAYVLYLPSHEGFIQEHNLHVIYRGKLSDVGVAVP